MASAAFAYFCFFTRICEFDKKKSFMKGVGAEHQELK
jgi:hypothetical protein